MIEGRNFFDQARKNFIRPYASIAFEKLLLFKEMIA